MPDKPSSLETRRLGQHSLEKSAATPLRVLAFTCSSQRPFFLRCCALQMQQQSYPVDHCIFINHPDAAQADEPYNYSSLLDDMAPAQGRITIGYGRSGTQQYNHLQALQLARLEDYDLFVKIDDDDIYRRHYIQGVVADFLDAPWDFSGSHAIGIIDGDKWGRRNRCTNLGMEEEDLRLKVPRMMPSSFAFSRAAIEVIRQIPDNIDINEDILWRRALVAHRDIRVHVRKESRMGYHLHGKNVSTWISFGKTL